MSKFTVQWLQENAESLGKVVLDAMYEENPFWWDRFGTRGRRFADQDSGYHVAYLVQAISTDDPAVFTRYATWLRSLLVSRGMCTLHVVEHFVRLERAIAERLEQAPECATLLAAGRDAIRHASAAASLVEGHGESLARLASERTYSDAWRSLGATEAAARERLRRDALHLVSYWADAVGAQRPELFAKHLQWQGAYYDKIGLGRVQAEHVVDALAEGLRELCTSPDAPCGEALRLLADARVLFAARSS